jgi:acetyl-CoA C-acetyltransferase
MTRSYLVAGARTPIGKFRGGLAPLHAVELGAVAVGAAIERAGISPEAVEYTVLGHVLQAGQGQITARQAAIAAGIPQHVPALTVNKVCLSGATAIALADQMIRAGEVEIVAAGGMESMTNAPYVLPTAREGSRLGDAPMIDAMIHDGLWCAFEDRHMGAATDAMNVELGVTREDQDRWAVRSQARAEAAWAEGRMDDEVVPLEVPQRRGEPRTVARDETMRPDTTLETLAGLEPAFTPDGTVTAGNASPISDGACAVIVASEQVVERFDLEPLAEIVAYGMAADRYAALHQVPALAMEKALKRAGLAPGDLGVVEINEAFAAVPFHAARMLDLDDAVVNVNGGAVALGHPIGASGARLALTLALEMRRRNATYGGLALCGGGGQGDALILRRA